MNDLRVDTRRLRLLGASAGTLMALAVLSPVPALAQQASTGKQASTANSDQEIVVTARRRSESLSRSAVAVTVFSSQDLLERSIRSDADLQISTPGLTIRQTQGNNSLTYTIRGQSADMFSGSPSAVVTYLNEVPLTISGASSFYDLESIQVLKGPQGTLFGRNTTGGAVLYTSAKPKNELSMLGRVRIGNLDLREAEGMLNVPIIADKVLLRGALDVVRRDGYILNLFNGDHLGKIRRTSGRVSLTLRPTDAIENTTVFQYTKTGGTNTGASYTYSVYSCGQTNNGFALNCGSGFVFGPTLDFIGGPGAWAAYLAAHPKAYAPGLIAYVDEQRRLGPYRTNHPGPAEHHGRDWMVTNTTNIDLSDNLKLRNIFGASHSRTRSEQPQLGAPFITILTSNLATGEFGNRQKVKNFSDEVQLQGTGFGGKLNYVAGIYFQRQTVDTLWPQTYFEALPILAPVTVTNNFRIRNKTDAAYAQGTYNITDALHFTAGLRWTRERVSIAQLPAATYTFGAPDQHKTFSDPSWEVGLEYQATPELFTYLKTRGSFRSGGFNGSAPPVNADATQGGDLFQSEHTQDIEGGVKFRGHAFGRPATLNIAVYNQWIQDVQRVEFPDPDGPGGLASIAVTVNLPAMRVRGIEVEGSIRPASWLEIGGSGALTAAKFTKNTTILFGNLFQFGPVGDTPRWTGTAYAQIDFPVSENVGGVRLRGEVYAQTHQYFSNSANSIAPGTKLPGYALVNGRLEWNKIMGSHFSAALFGKNLLDKAYFTGGMPLAGPLGHNAADVGEPRTYGVEVSFGF